MPRRAQEHDTDMHIPEENFGIVHANLLMPSYAVVLKIYQLHLTNGDPIASLRELEAFCAELFARGTRELLLGTLLLTGSGQGIQLASSIMKTSKMLDAESTLANLWNTSFDLTHSRLVGQASLPGFAEQLPEPRAFVTDDRMLGKLLERIDFLGAMPHAQGGGMSADNVRLAGYVRPELGDQVIRIILKSSLSARDERTGDVLVSRIRRHKAKVYAAQIEAWISHRFEEMQPPQASS